MARTIQVIYDSIIAEKQNQSILSEMQPQMDSSQTLLNDLNSTSKVGIWRLIFWVFAVAIWTVEKLWDQFKIDIETLRAQAVPGTAAWLQNEAFKFQFGDPLVQINNIFQYALTDASKQIIKRCAVADTFNSVTVKVAKLENEEPAGLSNEELTAFTNYMIYYKRFAGVLMNIVSQEADLLKISCTIYYDPLIELSEIKLNVAQSINNYLANLKFNGVLSVTRLTDYMQDASGVTDVVVAMVEAQPNGANYIEIERIYNPISGYFKIDTDFSAENFNYEPYV